MFSFFLPQGAVLIEAALLLNCVACGAVFRPLEANTTTSIPDPNDLDDEDDIKVTSNGKIYTGSEKPSINGHIPTVTVQSDMEDDAPPGGPLANGQAPINAPLLAIKSQMSGSAHSLPFSSQNGSSSLQIKRHASETLLHRVHRRKRTISEKTDDERALSPLARKDIFYSGSLANIPMYRSNPNMYSKSVISLASLASDTSSTRGRCSSRCLPACLQCSPEMKETFSQMMDFSLLGNPLFMMFAISNLFTSIGFCVPYTFLPDRAIGLGISADRAAFLIAVIGIANTVGRVVFGWLSDRPFINRLWLYNAALTLCGTCTFFSAFCRTYEWFIAYSASFGCFIGKTFCNYQRSNTNTKFCGRYLSFAILKVKQLDIL